MKIAVDALGGDYAPEEIVKGAILAIKDLPNCEIVLVGNTERVNSELNKYPKVKSISVINADDNIDMDEHPLQAVRTKKNCSINVGLRLVKDKGADGFVSAGNTGAVMASALLTLGRIKSVERPAIAALLPTTKSNLVVLDVGANADCRPSHLVQFAHMGSVYAEKVLGKLKPKINLLSIGEEDEKGNEVTQTTNVLLRKSSLNFKGNIEGNNLLDGNTDVVVCDGFVGNVVLKISEGVVKTIKSFFGSKIKWNVLGMFGIGLLLPILKKFKKKFNYQEYGGAPLLGVDGICIITHGRANDVTIKML